MNALLVAVALIGADFGDLNQAFVSQCKAEAKQAFPFIREQLAAAKRNKDKDSIAYWEEQVKLMRTGKLLVAPSFDFLNSQVGRYGRFYNCEIFQVIDKQNVLVEFRGIMNHDGIMYWVKTDTTELVEGRRWDTLHTFKLTGTKQYQTLVGKRTVLLAEPPTDNTGEFKFF